MGRQGQIYICMLLLFNQLEYQIALFVFFPFISVLLRDNCPIKLSNISSIHFDFIYAYIMKGFPSSS